MKNENKWKWKKFNIKNIKIENWIEKKKEKKK